MVLEERFEQTNTFDIPFSKERHPSYFQIAIDGPMGAGKTAVSEMVAKELGLLFISTGQLYRSLTLLALRENVSLDDEQGLLQLLQSHNIVLKPASHTDGNEKACVYIDDEDVTEYLHDNVISQKTPQAARHKLVRAEIVKKQQAFIDSGSVIMEGRDITHTVLPQAQLKIYLDAAPEARAYRRWLDVVVKNPKITLEDVLADLYARDAQDSKENLRKVPGVWIIDTTDMPIEDVVNVICDRVRAMMGKLI